MLSDATVKIFYVVCLAISILAIIFCRGILVMILSALPLYISDLLATEILPPNFDENKKYAVHFEV